MIPLFSGIAEIHSLKSHKRNIRGEGRRCKVVPKGKVPNNWKGFLKNSKTELIWIFSKKYIQYGVETGIAYATVANSTIFNNIFRLGGVYPFRKTGLRGSRVKIGRFSVNLTIFEKYTQFPFKWYNNMTLLCYKNDYRING